MMGLQVRQYPEMTNTVITVNTGYYGASADLIQGLVTQPLQQAIAQADNIDYISGSSYLGTSSITIGMKLNTDPSAAVADVLSKISSVQSQLPQESQSPSMSVSTGASTSVIYLAFSSEELNQSQINDYLARVVQPLFYTIEGVSEVNLYGGQDFGMRIWLDPQRMGAYGLSANNVWQILKSNNISSAPGAIEGYYMYYNAMADTQVTTVQEVKNLVVASRDGAIVRLEDIANVTLSKNHDIYRATADGKTAVVVGLSGTPSSNPLNIAADARKMLPEIEKNMPSTIKAKVLYDSTIAISESIHEVVHTIMEAAIIVLIVITLFMGSIRAVVIPIVTIPLSLIGVGLLMQVFGFSLNLMTLLALVLAIGLVVDDAIVVVENIDRHIKAGESPFRAAILGTREIAVPVISMTITLAAVYAPIALMGGITGSLFKEFALTLAGAVFISGILALTLSPMMSSKMLKAHSNPNAFERLVESTLSGLTRAYTRSLENVMAARPIMLMFGIVVFLLLPVLFKFIPSELAPTEDNGVFVMMGTAPNTANLDYVQNNMKLVTGVLLDQPEMESTIAFSGVPASNKGFGLGILVPWSDREASQKDVIKTVTKGVKEIPAMSIAAFPLPELPGASSGMPMQLVLTTSNHFESLFEITADILTQMKKSPIFVYSDMNLLYDSATMKINIDRDKAGSYGITMEDIGNTLSTMMSDGYINLIDLDGRGYQVIPQVERKDRLNPDAMNNYYVFTPDNDPVPLGNLIDVEIVPMPRVLPNFEQMNSATISAVLAPNYTMGDAVEYIENELMPQVPLGYRHSYMGEARQFVQEGSGLYITFVLAIIIIFLVLASQFESLRDPLVILCSVPLAISGALIFMAWGLTTMNIYSQVGLITLVGLISKHGILICEVAKEEQLHRGISKMEAVKYAASVRLRPILMTTAAMVAGLVPLLFAFGAGAVSRFDMGLVIVAGLSVGTVFTLYVLPVIYTYLASTHTPLPEFDESLEPKAAPGAH